MKSMTSSKKAKNQKPSKLGFFQMLYSLFKTSGKDEDKSAKQAYHVAFMSGGIPEYHPRKHVVSGYAAQNRRAKHRKVVLAKSSKR